MKSISEQIKYYREKAGLTQTELADKLGLSGHNIISYYENGQRTPSVSILEEMCQVLRCHFVIRGRPPVMIFREPEDILR